jgi:hypothetical protein
MEKRGKGRQFQIEAQHSLDQPRRSSRFRIPLLMIFKCPDWNPDPLLEMELFGHSRTVNLA